MRILIEISVQVTGPRSTVRRSTCVQIPLGEHTPELDSPFPLEQQLRAQASVANLLFCIWDLGGKSSYILLELICIHSLSACTFPELV